MTNYNELYDQFRAHGFIETRSDDNKILIDIHKAIELVLNSYELTPKKEATYEYGYLRPKGLGHSIVLIGDEQALEDYKKDVEESPNRPLRRYFKRLVDNREWTEIASPDSDLLA